MRDKIRLIKFVITIMFFWRKRVASFSSSSLHYSLSRSRALSSNRGKECKMASSVSVEPISLSCTDGIKLNGLRYSSSSNGHTAAADPSNRYRILCWHGWLDNCRSFYKLAPDLVEKLEASNHSSHAEVVALDFPGHGKSSHKSLDGAPSLLMELCYYVHEALRQLNWENESVTLIGHSMGAAVSLLYSAAFPVERLVLLDSVGPLPKPASDIARSLRQHIKARSRGKPPSSIYSSIEEAVEVRCLTAQTFPGKQYISKEAAKELVEGAIETLEDGRIEFQHDQRLKWTSILFVTREHLIQVYTDVCASKTKCCLLTAKDGMPFDAASLSTVRNTLQPAVMKRLDGSHHFHMDPDSASGVSNEIVNFLLE